MLETTKPILWPKLRLSYGLKADIHLAPYALIRSSVFSTLDYAGGAKRPEVSEQSLKLGAMKPYKVEQLAGVRLSQTDADFFFWMLAQAYRSGPPAAGQASVFFTRSEALTALKRTRGGKSDMLLAESLSRLLGAEFSIKPLPGDPARTRLLSRIEHFDSSSMKYDYKVTIADDVATLLANGQWLALPGKVRSQFHDDPLAKGLHALFASHKKVFPMFPHTLKPIVGRESMQDSKWHHALERSLAAVKQVTGWVECEVMTAGTYEGKAVVHRGLTARRFKKARKADAEPLAS